ncbi:hypothetical protein [Paraburkholderia dilworthii]|nr:hypothetical protein [Paraburkholderia dilworthii]
MHLSISTLFFSLATVFVVVALLPAPLDAVRRGARRADAGEVQSAME